MSARRRPAGVSRHPLRNGSTSLWPNWQLQGMDLLPDRRVSQVQKFGRRRQAPQPGSLVETPQLLQRDFLVRAFLGCHWRHGIRYRLFLIMVKKYLVPVYSCNAAETRIESTPVPKTTSWTMFTIHETNRQRAGDLTRREWLRTLAASEPLACLCRRCCKPAGTSRGVRSCPRRREGQSVHLVVHERGSPAA